jgi:hypothetical protein
MPGLIGSFQQILRTFTTPGSAPASAPQQGPAGPPQGTTGGASSPSSFFTDSFSPTRPAPRNPVLAPDPVEPPEIPNTSMGGKTTTSTTGSFKPSVMLGPGMVGGSVEADVGVKVEGGLFSIEVKGYTEVGASFSRNTAMTTFSVEAEVGMKGEVSLDAKYVSGGANAAGGVRGSYQVTLPTSAAANITTPEQAAEQLNPTKPQNLPVGATVTVDSAAFSEMGLKGGLFGLELSLGVEHSDGTSLTVSKLDDKTLRVTVGDTQAVTRNTEAIFGGLVGGGGTLTVGGQPSARQVDIDISKPEGMAAYQRFLDTGELPKNDPAMGVSNAATVQVANESHSLGLTLLIDFGSAEVDTSEYIATTYDAGGPTEFQYTGRKGEVTFSISGEWKDPEDPSTYTYSVVLPGMTDGDIGGMQQVYAGGTGTGNTVTVSFTREEALQLHQLVKDYTVAVANGTPGLMDPHYLPGSVWEAAANAATPEEAMGILMTPTAASDSTRVSYRLAELANFSRDHGSGQMPGSLTLMSQG